MLSIGMRSPPSAAVVVAAVAVGLEREREGLDAEDLLRLTRPLDLCIIGHCTYVSSAIWRIKRWSKRCFRYVREEFITVAARSDVLGYSTHDIIDFFQVHSPPPSSCFHLLHFISEAVGAVQSWGKRPDITGDALIKDGFLWHITVNK